MITPEQLKEDNIKYLQIMSNQAREISRLTELNNRLIEKEIQYKAPEDDEDICVVVDNATAEYCELFPEGHWASSIEIAQLFHRHWQDYRLSLRYGGLSKHDVVADDSAE